MENWTNSEKHFSKSADTGVPYHSGFLPTVASQAMKQKINGLS